MTSKLDSLRNKLGSGRPLHYVAGDAAVETSYVGLYYMLNKVFVAADTPQGSFDSGMATILEKSSEEEAGMYLIHLYSGPSKLLVRGPSPYLLPITMMHQVMRVGGRNTTANASVYCFRCLEVVHVILPSQLTGIPSLAKAVFEMKWEYGPCCLLFKSGKPSRFVPLSMTDITVSGSSASQSQTSMVQTPAVASGFKMISREFSI